MGSANPIRWAAAMLLLLVLATADGVSPDFNRPLPLGCHRFDAFVAHPRMAPAPAQVNTSPETPFRYAVHTLYLDEIVAELAVEIGFDTVVQVFPWRDLNPGFGQFAWESSDSMLQTARRHGLDLVIRLDMPPSWAVRSSASVGGLPFDIGAYAAFVSAVADRYRDQDRVLGYIIWNEPNLAAEWSRSGGDLEHHWSSYSGWVADPADYVGVLGIAYEHIKTADPDALVISAGLAPTNENSPRAMDDRLFLKGMLESGAAGCFDILGIHAYGYGLEPDVARTTHDGLNLARILDLQEVMQSAGVQQPAWITELGYTIGAGQHPSVTETQQAEYLVGALRHVRQEWPWVGAVTVWNLSYGLDETNEMSGFSLLESDQAPRLAYARLRQLLTQGER